MGWGGVACGEGWSRWVAKALPPNVITVCVGYLLMLLSAKDGTCSALTDVSVYPRALHGPLALCGELSYCLTAAFDYVAATVRPEKVASELLIGL